MPSFPQVRLHYGIWGGMLRNFFSPYFDLDSGEFLVEAIPAASVEGSAAPHTMYASGEIPNNVRVVFIDCSLGDVVPTLPSLSSLPPNARITCQKIDSSDNIVSGFSTQGPDTIVGPTDGQKLVVQFEKTEFVKDGDIYRQL